ncbi:MAG: tetratricopeptide repeat protein [Myxococcales bacterium]|nr:tetratricopeptide repeat protein [Myxococcales bacterium]
MFRWLAALCAALVPFGAAHASPPSSVKTPQPLADFARDARRFGASARQYRATIARVVWRAYGARRRAILARYHKRVGVAERGERRLRRAAIARFERFVSQHRGAGRFGAEVMFRLAELYRDEAGDTYLTAMQRYEHEQARFDRGARARAPSMPKPNYQRSIALHQRIVREHPRSRLRAASTYLLGILYGEMSDEKQAMAALAALVCQSASGQKRYQGCRPMRGAGVLLADAWLRLGEQHFDRNELARAIAAYSASARYATTSSSVYDKALYKLAWSHYRADHYAEAIKAFDALVVFSDRRARGTSRRAGSLLRPESVSYLGICFAEQDWDGDGKPDGKRSLARLETFYQRRRAEPHVREIYRALQRVLFDTARYAEAAAVGQRVLALWPLDRKNPHVAARVVSAYEQAMQPKRAAAARRALSQRFAAGSPWARRHRRDAKALASARALRLQMLLRAALYRHEQARSQPSVARYLAAARAYRELLGEQASSALDGAPRAIASRRVALWRALASCLFAAHRYEQAARAYLALRDDARAPRRDRELAAFMATKAHEARVDVHEATAAAGAADVLAPMPQPRGRAGHRRALPPLYLSWQRALDGYVERFADSARAPALAYGAAILDLRARDLVAARRRLMAFVARYRHSPLRKQAAQALLVSYQIDHTLPATKRYAALARWARLAGNAALLRGLRFKGASALHRRGEALLSAGKSKQAHALLERAARGYLALVNAAPMSRDAEVALHNAALCYERSRRLESARDLYDRLARRYPKSKLAAPAMWRAAQVSERLMSFDDALARYLRVARQRSLAAAAEQREAMLAAARILRFGGKHRQAAALYARFAASGASSGDRRAAPAELEAVRSLRAAGDISAALGALRRFSATFKGRVSIEQRLEALALEAALYHQGKHRRRALAADRRVVAAFAASGLSATRAPRAAEAAARSAFRLAERRLAPFLARRLSGSAARVVAELTRLERSALALERAYEAVYVYKSAPWTVSAVCRTSQIDHHIARSFERPMRAAPLPRALRRLCADGIRIYRQRLSRAVAQRIAPRLRLASARLARCAAGARRYGVVSRAVSAARARVDRSREHPPRVELLAP